VTLATKSACPPAAHVTQRTHSAAPGGNLIGHGKASMRDGELKPGDKCDRYQIIRLIAAGGMGEVYEAVHEFTARPVALKCLQLRHANKDDLKDRMKMEAVVLCRLRHANIVTVYDAGITDRGMVWIAMDLLVGNTLREILHRVGRLTVPQALYYACEIADGVDAAHELRVVHRDLKPENVFVTERNEVKVLDLGTAKFYGYGLKTTDRMRTLGTPAYMSPEHITGTPVDVRTAIYGLGLILYEMLAGHHVFAKDGQLPNSLDMGTAQLFQEPTPLPQLIEGFPDYLWAIVAKSIAKKRD